MVGEFLFIIGITATLALAIALSEDEPTVHLPTKAKKPVCKSGCTKVCANHRKKEDKS